MAVPGTGAAGLGRRLLQPRDGFRHGGRRREGKTQSDSESMLEPEQKDIWMQAEDRVVKALT